MSGLDIQEPGDSLVDAQAKRIANVTRRMGHRLMPGTGQKERATTTFESIVSKLAVPEEIISKAIGKLTTNDPKYNFDQGIGNYHTQTGFADNFRDTGMDPVPAAILGIAAAILNPLDPLNKVKILAPTKLGKAAGIVETAGKNLVKGEDNLWRISSERLIKDLASREKGIADGIFHPDLESIVKSSIKRDRESLKHADELNEMLIEVQKRGVKLEDLKLAGSTYEQVRTGQRHLIGFGPIRSHGLSSRTPSVYGFGGKVGGSLVKATSKVTGAIFKPLKDYAYKVADYIGIPTIRDGLMSDLSASVKQTLDNGAASLEEKQRDLISTYTRFLREYGPEGGKQAKEDMLTVLQAVELRNSGVKEMAIAELNKIPDSLPPIPQGKGVVVEYGGGLSDDQKLRLTKSGVDESEIPLAVGRYEQAHVSAIPLGTHGEHQLKLLGRYVVVKSSDPKAFLSDLDELDGVFGNRVWSKHIRQNADETIDTFLIQKRHPGARRITKSDDFEPKHLKMLESIAAQLSSDKNGFTVLKPADILVSPSGAVQIVNPSVIVKYKGQKEAITNSKQALDNLADSLNLPKGPIREFPSLANTDTARSVPRGLSGLDFRAIADPDIPAGVVVDMDAHKLLEQAINTDGFKDLVRASYDERSANPKLHMLDPVQFERSNDVTFHREQIRKAIDAGMPPSFDPITITRDKAGNLYIANHPARLTAAILEGFETVQVYNRGFVGEAATSGFITGRSTRLTHLWSAAENSSGADLVAGTRGIVAPNYSLIPRSGNVIKLTPASITTDPEMMNLMNRFVSLGLAGDGRNERVTQVTRAITRSTGGIRNGLMRLSEMAEASPDFGTFVTQVESLLVNPRNGQGIKLDNILRHPQAENLFLQLKNAATKNLDELANRGVLTTQTVNEDRRVLLASDNSDLVVHVMDERSNTLKVYGNQATTAHLKTTAESFINKTTKAEDVEPYARIQLFGADGQVNLEVKDLVEGIHPRIVDVLEPVTDFVASAENLKALEEAGIYVAKSDNVASIKEKLQAKGLNFGVLLGKEEKPILSRKTGTPLPGGATQSVIVRPEFTFFASPSGALVVSTKHANVQDLVKAVFEEGPAFFEEFGVMTTGKIIMSNPFGAKMAKIGLGEVRTLQDRIQLMAKRFKDLGFSEGTLLDVKVPFDQAIWRAMYGERVTIGEVLDPKFHIEIPPNLKNHVPDMHVLAPGRLGAMPNEVGVIATERTRLGNERMQTLFDQLLDYSDRIFLEKATAGMKGAPGSFIDQAKLGLPITYYSSWFNRNLSVKMKEALQEVWMNYPDKTSKTYKFIEENLKGRVLPDLTTQEVNTIIKRLKKEGIDGAESIISDVVKAYRDGYVLHPSKHTTGILSALAEITPEGIDFYHLDPIWNTALSAKAAQAAINRFEIVQSIKDLKVAVWSGTIPELNALKIGRGKKAVELDAEILDIKRSLSKAQTDFEKIGALTPDLQKNQQPAILKAEIDRLTNQLELKQAERLGFISDVGKGKALDTMVDLESEQIWIKGESLTKLIDDGIIHPSDILGDPSDAFVRVPIKKYASLLEGRNEEVFLFPKEVANVVRKYFETTSKDGFGKFLTIWDTVHHLWRNWTLFPIPAYHVRNGISNLFMAYLGDVDNPRSYSDAWSIMHLIDGHRKGSLSIKEVQESLGAMSFASADGTVYTGQQVFDEFSRHGGLAGGLNYNEFNRFRTTSESSAFNRLSVQAGLTPSSDLAGSWLFDNAALRLGVKAAAYTENRFRLATFIDALTKGRVETQKGMVLSGFDAASIHMKRVFYDYSDLSAFERSVLRRTIPFYSWSRHNIPRMLMTMMTDPIKHYRMAEMFHSMETGATEGEPVNENDLPKWVRERFGIIISKDKKTGSYLVKTSDGFLPITDAYKMFSGEGIMNMVKDSITPIVKVPFEQLANYSVYADRPLEKVPGQRAASFTLGQMGFSRRATTEGPLGVLNLVLNEPLFKTFFRPGGELVSKVLDPIFDGKEGPSLKLGVLAAFIGKAYEIDPQMARMTIYRDWKKRHQQIVSLRNQAVSQGDIKSVEDADRMLTWLRLQAPGGNER